MFAGGDKTKIANDAKKYFCGGAFKPRFDPATDGDAACKGGIDATINSAYAGLSTHQADALDAYMKVGYGQPYFECLTSSGIAAKGANRTTGSAGTKCMDEYAKGTKKISLTGANTAGAPAEFKSFDEYVKWAVSMVKQGISADDFAFDRIPIPADLRAYLDALGAKKYPGLAENAERLFREAMSEVPTGDQLKAALKISAEIMLWTEVKKLLLDEAMAPGADAAKGKTAEAAKKEIIITYVDKVDGDPDFGTTLKNAPDSLFRTGNEDIDKALAKPAVIAEFRRLFVEALKDFRAQKGKDENANVIAKATASAVKFAFESFGDSFDLVNYKAYALLEDDTTLAYVYVVDGKVAGVPRKLIDEMGARGNPALAYVLADIWGQVVKLAAEKGIDLNDTARRHLRDAIVDDLLKKLKDIQTAGDAIIMYVDKAKSDITKPDIVLATAGGINTSGLAESAKLAVLKKAKELYASLLEVGGTRFQDEGHRRDLANYVASASETMIRTKGLAAFEGCTHDGFVDTVHTQIKPLKYEPAKQAGGGGNGEITVSVGSVDGNLSVKGSAAGTIPFAKSEDGEVTGVVNFGIEGGHTPSQFDRLPSEPYQKLPADADAGAVSNLNLGVVHKLKNANFTTTGTAGWMGEAATGIDPILGVSVGSNIQLNFDPMAPESEKKNDQTLTLSLAVGTPHQFATYAETPEPNFGNRAIQPEGKYSFKPNERTTISIMGAYRYTGGDDPTKHDLIARFTPDYTTSNKWKLKAPATLNVTFADIDSRQLKLAPSVTTPSLIDSKDYTLTATGSSTTTWLSASSKIAATRGVDTGFEATSHGGQIDLPNASKKSTIDATGKLCLGWGGDQYSACFEGGRVFIEDQDDANKYGVTVGGKF